MQDYNSLAVQNAFFLLSREKRRKKIWVARLGLQKLGCGFSVYAHAHARVTIIISYLDSMHIA